MPTPIQKPLETFRKLETIARLADEGKNQGEIATAVGMRDNQELRRWLQGEGFIAKTETVVLVTLTGERLSDVLRRGQIVPTAAAEPATA